MRTLARGRTELSWNWFHNVLEHNQKVALTLQGKIATLVVTETQTSYYQILAIFRLLIAMNRRSHSTSSDRVTQFDSWHLYPVPYHHTNQTWDIPTNHHWSCWRWPKVMAKTSLKQVASRKKPQLFAVWLRFKRQLTGWKRTWLVSRNLSRFWSGGCYLKFAWIMLSWAFAVVAQCNIRYRHKLHREPGLIATE